MLFTMMVFRVHHCRSLAFFLLTGGMTWRSEGSGSEDEKRRVILYTSTSRICEEGDWMAGN